MIKILKDLSALLVVSMLAGCGQPNPENTLIVGMSADYPPFESIENNKVVGFDVDLINAIASHLDMDIVIKEMPFQSLIPSIGNDINMAISGFGPSPERLKQIDFSIGYYSSPLAVVSLKSNTINSIDALSNKVIGAQLGTQMVKWGLAQDLTITQLESNPLLIQELLNEKLDGVLCDLPTAKSFVFKNPALSYHNLNVENESVAIALAKDSALTDIISSAIEDLEANGILHQLKTKWDLL